MKGPVGWSVIEVGNIPFKIEAPGNSRVKGEYPEYLSFAQNSEFVPPSNGCCDFFNSLHSETRYVLMMYEVPVSSHIGVMIYIDVI